ncbi:MAG: hypothetical protein WCJ94_05745 [bacterium]
MNGEKRNAKLKELLKTQAALGIICFYNHYKKTKTNGAKLAEVLKIPVSKIKETCEKLAQCKVLTVSKTGSDLEIKFIMDQNDEIKQTIDEAIWENNQEYGSIYHKIITTELRDFMEGNK